MTDKEELKALLKSYKESPSRGIKDEITISKIEDIIIRIKAFFEGIQGAGTNITENHTNCSQHENA